VQLIEQCTQGNKESGGKKRYTEDEVSDYVKKPKISMLHKTGRDVSVLVSGGLLGAFA